MSGATSDRRSNPDRVPLGVPSLDEMLDGGLRPHRPYLIVGPAGTGKTALALEFLCEGVRRGEPSLYVTLEDPPNEVRWNHRALRPELDRVDVFDAIPDVMRYERVPFKDISAVRKVVPFQDIAERIRLTPEFSSVEVTGTALEQMLRSEVQKHGYTRLVIDSLTALQYFCMKGFDPVVGAQSFLRFLTDLRTTTLLTIEAPLEDVEGPERMLARGEIRLFRWELEGATVRAVGVEKIRGSAHDIRLHPYRIGPTGLDIQLAQTISKDTRQILGSAVQVVLGPESAVARPAPAGPSPPAAPTPSVEPLSRQIQDLVTLGVDLRPIRAEVEATLAALRDARSDDVAAGLARISALVISLGPQEAPATPTSPPPSRAEARALHRVAARADHAREGQPPTELPPSEVLARDLGEILEKVPARPARAEPQAPTPARSPEAARPSTPAPAPAAAPPPPAPALPTPTRSEPPVRAEPPITPPSAPEAPPPSAPPPAPASAADRQPPSTPSPSVHAVARASALLGEPIPRPTGASPTSAGKPPAARVPPPLPEPPRLPSVASFPVERPARTPPRGASPSSASTGPALPSTSGSRATSWPPAPPGAPEADRAAPPIVEETTPALAAPPPRRRRRTTAAKPSAAPTEGEAIGPVVAKTRRRTVRRKKAPPVVAASPEVSPPEPTAVAPPPPPSPTPAAEPTVPPEGP